MRLGAGRLAYLLARLVSGGRELAWPVAIVAESPDDRSVVFRTYFSQRSLDGRHHLRSPVLRPGSDHPGDVVGRHQTALAATSTRWSARSLRRATTASPSARSPPTAAPLSSARSSVCASAGGGIGLEHTAVTDDGVRCAVEYNCVHAVAQAHGAQLSLTAPPAGGLTATLHLPVTDRQPASRPLAQ